MRLLVLFISLAAILGAIAWTQGNTGDTMVKNAHPIGRVETLTDYQWLSDQALLLPKLPDRRGVMRWQPPAAETEITGLSSRVASRSETTTDWLLSPDRSQLLWLENAGSAWAVAAAPVEGATVSRWPIEERTINWYQRGGNAAWLPDNRRFFMVRYLDPDLLVQIYDTQSGSAEPKEYRVPFKIPSPPRAGARYHLPAPLGVSPANHLFVVLMPIALGRSMPPEWILELDLAHKPAIVAEHRFRLGHEESADAVKLSPDGKRLAQLVSQWPQSQRGPVQMEVRTCGLDGEDVRTLGRMDVGPLATRASSPVPPRPRLLRWLPGGKKLSFEYRGRLYAIEAQ